MSNSHSVKFWKKGGKCPTVILASFGKKEENVLLSSDKFSQKEENFRRHSVKFLKKGGKCLTVILTTF